MNRDQLTLDGVNELDPGSLFGGPAQDPVDDHGPMLKVTDMYGRSSFMYADGTPIVAPAPRVIDADGREQCPACGGPFERRAGEAGGYCERCGQLRASAARLKGTNR